MIKRRSNVVLPLKSPLIESLSHCAISCIAGHVSTPRKKNVGVKYVRFLSLGNRQLWPDSTAGRMRSVTISPCDTNWRVGVWKRRKSELGWGADRPRLWLIFLSRDNWKGRFAAKSTGSGWRRFQTYLGSRLHLDYVCFILTVHYLHVLVFG